jgi:hypothetical protein
MRRSFDGRCIGGATMPETTLRTNLNYLARALRSLHKTLIDIETVYFGQVGSPLEHLQLITNHPHFAWLQKMSGVMAEIDERLDAKEPIDDDTAASLRAVVESLIGPRTPVDADFRQRYNTLLHDGADVVMAHAGVRQALQKLPSLPDEPAPASATA